MKYYHNSLLESLRNLKAKLPLVPINLAKFAMEEIPVGEDSRLTNIPLKDSGIRQDFHGQRSEDRGQKTEDRRQKTKNRC